MLRNTGVNVTEHKIRQEVQKAYEYDYFHECSRRAWGRDNEVRYAGMRRQPRYYYSNIPRHLPTHYQSARSSISSYTRPSDLDRVYGVKRIYLPEKDLRESSYFIRKPSYREKYYSNQKPYHIAEGERPYRRDNRFNNKCPRRTSSMCYDENEIERLIDATRCMIDNYCPKKDSFKYRKPARKITKKLSPIFTCDCTSPFSAKPSKRTFTAKLECPIRTHTKPKNNQLSKEAKKISQDIYKILSLMQKSEAEEEEQYSSDSVLQQIHDFECCSTNNVTRRKTDLITERVQIYPKMEKERQDPITKLKNITGVRSKLEALVNVLKQYEDNSGSNVDIVAKNKKPPSPEVQPFLNEKEQKSSNDETKKCQDCKDVVLQTEEPKTSNKSICGRIKNNNSTKIEAERSLKSRLSSKFKEKLNSKKRNERDKERGAEVKNKMYYKKKSKDKISSENEASKQNLTNNSREIKTGLMITIGGKVLRKKPVLAPEKRLEKMSKTWIKKYLDTKKETKDHNIHQRWNNRSFYNRSSTTVVEVINNVYKQMGINLKSKYNDASRKHHTKSSKKTRNRQTIEAYMMPRMVMHNPVYISEDRHIAKSQVSKGIDNFMSKTKLPFEQNIDLQNKCPMYSNTLNFSNDPSSIFFRIYMAKDYFDTVSKSNQTLKISNCDEQVYKSEHEATKSDVINNAFTGNRSRKCDKPALHHCKKKNDEQVSHDSSCFRPKFEGGKKIAALQDMKKNTAKLEYQVQEPAGNEANLYTLKASNVRACELTHNQKVKIQPPVTPRNVPLAHFKKSEDTELQLVKPEKKTKTKTKYFRNGYKDFMQVDHKIKFYSSKRGIWSSNANPMINIRQKSSIDLFKGGLRKQFKKDKCTYFSLEHKRKCESVDHEELRHPSEHQIMRFPSSQHLQSPLYLPQLSCKHRLLSHIQGVNPQYPPQSQDTPIPRQSYKLKLVCHTKNPVVPSDRHHAPKTEYASKFLTSLDPQYEHQAQYSPVVGPTLGPKHALQEQYLGTANLNNLNPISKWKNSKFSSIKSYIRLKSDSIYISNDENSDKINNLRLSYAPKSRSNRETVANNMVVKQIVKPTFLILKSRVKINFSVENIKIKDFIISENQIYNTFSHDFSSYDRDHITVKRPFDSAAYESKIAFQNCSNFINQTSRHFYSNGTDPLNYEACGNSVQPNCVAEYTIRDTTNSVKTDDSKVNTNLSLGNFNVYNVIEEYLIHLLGETEKNYKNKVVETKRMLHALMTMNTSGSANISYASEELINCLTYSSIRPQISMNKEIVPMFSKVRKNDKKADLLEQQAEDNNDENILVKSKTNRSSRIYNFFAKFQNRRCQKVDKKSNSYIKTKRDNAPSCCLLNLGNHVMQRPNPVTRKSSRTFSFFSMGTSINRNAVDDIGTSYREPKSKVQSSEKDKLNTNVKQTVSQCVKYAKKNSTNKNEKKKMQMNTEERDATSSAYLLVKPSRSQEKPYFIEHNDTFENKNPVGIDNDLEILNYDPINNILNNVTDPADILQSYIVKKAALQIYIEESAAHNDYLVAKLPKHVSL